MGETSTSIRFSPKESAIGSLGGMTFKTQPRLLTSPYDVGIRLYAPTHYLPKVTASRGSISKVLSSSEDREEGLTFSGTDSVSLGTVPTGSVSVTAKTSVFGLEGLRTSVNFTYNPETNTITASKPCFCMVIVKYSAGYTLYGYTYQRERPAGMFGLILNGGTLFAFNVTTKTTASLEIPNGDYSVEAPDHDKVELWREESSAVMTEDGLYEQAIGYPATDFIPADYIGYRVEVKRTHAIMYVDSLGRTNEDKFSVPIGLPFQTGSTGQDGLYPNIKVVYARVSDDLPTSLRNEALRYIAAKQAQED
ncbi:MAG: hypothetical protein GQ570_03920 [Helicobacteraceae bacterium]|nr:hypothetical protein [Helicobacteraceae bacterium]